MNDKRRIFFILTLLLITGSSALLFAKAQLDKGMRYVIYAGRGEIMAITTSPNQGRIRLVETDDKVTLIPQKGESQKEEMRPFLVKWPEFNPKGSITFQYNQKDVHLEITCTNPYYEQASGILTFDIFSPTSLMPYHDIYEVHLYIHD